MLQEGGGDEQISAAKTEQSGSRREKLLHHGAGHSPLPLLQGARKKVIAIGVYHRQTTEGRGRGRRVTIGIPDPNLAECRVNSTPPHSCPNVAQSHTDFEVLNRTRHTSPKMGVNLD